MSLQTLADISWHIRRVCSFIYGSLLSPAHQSFHKPNRDPQNRHACVWTPRFFCLYDWNFSVHHLFSATAPDFAPFCPLNSLGLQHGGAAGNNIKMFWSVFIWRCHAAAAGSEAARPWCTPPTEKHSRLRSRACGDQESRVIFMSN